MAQVGSAPVLGTGGRRFKSYHPDHKFINAEYWWHMSKLTEDEKDALKIALDAMLKLPDTFRVLAWRKITEGVLDLSSIQHLHKTMSDAGTLDGFLKSAAIASEDEDLIQLDKAVEAFKLIATRRKVWDGNKLKE